MRKLVINAVDRKEILKLIRKKNSINKSLRKRKMKDRKDCKKEMFLEMKRED